MAKTFTNLTVANATAGNAILASDHSSAFTTLNNHTVPPMAKVTQATVMTGVTVGTYVTYNNAAASIDTDGMWSSGSNTRLTVQTAGVYLVIWNFQTGWSGVSYHNDLHLTRTTSGGTESIIGQDYRYLNGDNWVTANLGTIATIVDAAVGDYFRCKWSNQVNGTALTLSGNTLNAKWLGKTA